MDVTFTYILYGMAITLLAMSFLKDKKKTLLSLKRAVKMFMSVLPQFAAILLLVGTLLTVLRPETIQSIIGAQSGFTGMIIASLVGAVALVPALIALPIAAELLNNGAGIAQIAVFISALTTVGVVTFPLEAKYLGKKVAFLRNMLSYLFSFGTAVLMGVILK